MTALASHPRLLSERSRPAVNPWLIALTVSMATFMEVMDTSIANVALRYIAGGLAAGQSESTWVLTSYLVSNAIILPISGWLSSVLGRKRFYMICVALFTASSFLCGIAPNLGLLLFFRVLQGAGGGGLAPSEQAILADTFEPRQRGLAFALYGMAVVVAPAIGPTLGGWITDTIGWRWIFFINIPVGLLSLFLTHLLVTDSENAKQEHRDVWKGGKLKVDFLGFGLIAIGLGSLQIVLDKGQEDDWFGSTFITSFAVLAAIGILGCIIWELWIAEQPIVDLPLFKDFSFLTTNLVMFATFFVLLGTTQLLPQFTQESLGYDATTAGLILMPGGFVIMCLMPLVGRLVNIIQPRYLIAFGLFIMGMAMIHLTSLDLQVSFGVLALARCFQTAGMAFLFVPINTAAYIGLPKGKSNNASALINLMRNLGGSVGVSVAATILARRSQFHQNRLIGNVSSTNPAYLAALHNLTTTLLHAGTGTAAASQTAVAMLYQSVQNQASILSYLDVFQILAYGSFAMIPLALLMKKSKPGEKMHAGH
jgi:MFS transporter, DHA2 family, multidrug resistance protein